MGWRQRRWLRKSRGVQRQTMQEESEVAATDSEQASKAAAIRIQAHKNLLAWLADKRRTALAIASIMEQEKAISEMEFGEVEEQQ